MNPAPDVARAADAAIRPSIAARPRRSGAALGALALGLALAVALALAGPAGAQISSGPPLPVGTPEPVRPTVTVPYDGAIAPYRAGRADEALGLAERALQSDPRNPQLRFLRGVILAEKGRRDDAAAVFRGLTEDFPELPEPYNNLAVLHAAAGEWEAARAAIEQSIRAVPGYALAHENLGDVHLQLAASAYERAGRLDPRNESARGKLALARELIARAQALPVDSRTPRLGAPSPSSQVTPR
jgi:tetratricopeptide (TPR) repeat protein